MKYAVIYEPTKTAFSAYVPDLPGCIATGRDFEATQKRMEKAIDMHIAASGRTAIQFRSRRRRLAIQQFSGTVAESAALPSQMVAPSRIGGMHA